ncbi:MAG: radical SAM protein [Thermoprotei archaeon]|nr:MAG: radical SAM protein [Thermoprotei archaeon]
MHVKLVKVKSVLNKHRKRDEWFLDDYSLNPYYGCNFGCLYCYIRGGKYGRDELAVKVNAPTLLEKELAKYVKLGEYGFIALSSATEPWMLGIENRYEITRACLNIILKYKFPVHCLTKSTLILRDLDILSRVNEEAIVPQDLRSKVNDGVLVTFSFSTLNEDLARLFEPRAPTPKERINALMKIRDEGFKVGAAFIPILPFITDNELEDMVKLIKELNLNYVFFSPLTLSGKCKELFLSVVRSKFPELYGKYVSLYRYGASPAKWYRDRFYLSVKELLHRYGLRFGI